MMIVSFYEVRKTLQDKVIRAVLAKVEHTNAGVVSEAFYDSSVLKEVEGFCRKKYGEKIPFPEISKIEDQFLRSLIDDVVSIVGKGG